MLSAPCWHALADAHGYAPGAPRSSSVALLFHHLPRWHRGPTSACRLTELASVHVRVRPTVEKATRPLAVRSLLHGVPPARTVPGRDARRPLPATAPHGGWAAGRRG